MTILNRHQPDRPRVDDNGNPLMYTTIPKMRKRQPKFMDRPAKICQSRLYRAIHNGDVPKRVAIGDLYQFLFPDEAVTKNQMGAIVVSALIYEPRMLVNSRLSGGPASCYNFHNLLELKYGLEWMICMWLRRFLNENAAREREVVGPEMMAVELERLASCSEEEYIAEYESQYLDDEEPDWTERLRGKSEWVPPRVQSPPKARPPKPRDLSVLS